MSSKKQLYHGAAYYPELWDAKTREEDIRLMKKTGINVVRMGEFAWSTMEPEEDNIDIQFFADMIDQLYHHGIDTIMCTPTPTPPIWLSHGHPERMHVHQDGTTMAHGSRQHVCTNHPYFRKRAAIITEHMARAIGTRPGLVGWQIDNELKAHVGECYCATCQTLWHQWLEERYGTIHKLNEAWGTAIWSQYYQTFQQVPQPGPTPFLHNAALKTMYQFFSMEMLAAFTAEQAEMIRRYSKAPITHNGSFGFKVDNERIFQSLDFASFDTYASIENAGAYIMNCDFWRNVKEGRPVWVMETSPSYNAHLEGYASPHPNGYLKAEAVAAYALGAEAFCYWLWRQQRTGSEQPHGSVISAWGKPTVGYPNVLEVEQVRKDIEPYIVDTVLTPAEVAMTYSDRAKTFLTTEPHRQLNYRSLTSDFHQRLLEMGIHRDLILEGHPLNHYKLLFTPFMPYISEAYMQKAQAFVEQGGIWVVGPLSGGRTSEHTIHTDAALGKNLERLAGVETLYTFPMDPRTTEGEAFGERAALDMWSAVFKTKGGTMKGVIRQGVTPGEAFITEHKVGQGKVVMLGAMPVGENGHRMLKRLIDHYAQEANINHYFNVTPGTIVAPRQGNDYNLWCVVNMDGKGGRLTIPRKGSNPVTGEKVSAGTIRVDPFEHLIIRFEKE
ncbi:beta-galactosidase [Caldalkalibacillus salinus]|uniref:beta-galactosidase n=1 Tax=Caldalkalibacillus salinus TaxID=2803787 RepID=UPI0019224194|nr:beta-galactosidase [Caldalkalibacillus salinus]